MSTLTRRQFLKLGAASLASLAWPARAVMADSPKVALTFDDGFVNVDWLLDVCRSLDVRLTLFPIGQVIENNPGPWRRAVADGHEIGCHTYTHQVLAGQPYETVAYELSEFMRVARTYLGLEAVRYFRPPYGSGWNDEPLKAAARDFGMTVAMWNRVFPFYSGLKPNWRMVVRSFERHAQPGDVFLHHFRREEVAALPHIAGICQQRGWQIAKLSSLH